MAANVTPFAGKGYDSEAVEERIAELIEGDDIRQVYDDIDFLAALKPRDYAYAVEQLRTHFKKRLNLRELGANVKRAQAEKLSNAKRGASRVEIADVGDDDLRPRVCVTDREPTSLAREVITNLARAAKPEHRLYRQGTRLVRVRPSVEDRLVIEPVGEEILSNIIEHTMVLYRVMNADEGFAVNAPRELVRFILAQHVWPFPELDGITPSPIIRPDGTIASTLGYDQATRRYIAPDPDLIMPEIKERPTRKDAERACADLAWVLQNTPFADSAGLANTIATALTFPLRASIRGNTPACLIDATRQSSGKTGLSKFILAAGTGLPDGRAAHSPPWIEKREEQEKRIETALMQGASAVWIDNIRGIINLPALESMLTKQTHDCRRLGKSESPTVSAWIVWMFTGNGLRPGGDLFRRIYYVHIDPGTTRPDERDSRAFAVGDMEVWLADPANRSRLLGDVLTMIRAWIVAGRPAASTYQTFSNYQEWADTIAAILEFCGMSGFLSTLKQDKEGADEDSEQWLPFLEAIYQHYGSDEFNVRTLASLCTIDPDGELAMSLPPHLYGYLGKAGRDLHTAMGHSFANRIGRPYGKTGIRIEKVAEDGHTKTGIWRVRVADLAPRPPAPPSPPAEPDSVEQPEADAVYAREPWYRAGDPQDRPASRAMLWVCRGDVMAAAGWTQSARLFDAFETHTGVVTWADRGLLSPGDFTLVLRALYDKGDHASISMIAQTLGAHPERVLIPLGMKVEAAI